MKHVFLNSLMIAGLMGGLALVAPFVTPVNAQEGHPLTGSWHGTWGASANQRSPLFIYMKWDNKNVVGTLNPGPNGAPLKTVTLDPAKWMVHIESDAKDKSGAMVHIVADGK